MVVAAWTAAVIPVAICYAAAFVASIALWRRGYKWNTDEDGDPAIIASVAAMTRQL